VPLEGFTVDAHWPGTTLVVEIDGYRFHRMPSVFEADRDRDQVLAVAGYTVSRFTKRQLERPRAESAQRLRALLARCGAFRVP
jgi:very-short-patch-repair endonuclease